MTTLGLFQFTHVYSIKEIHHIDDDGVGGVHTEVRRVLHCNFLNLNAARKFSISHIFSRLILHCVFQENISKAPRVQRHDYSIWSHGCSVVRFYCWIRYYYPYFQLNTLGFHFIPDIRSLSIHPSIYLSCAIHKLSILIRFMLCF